MTTSASDFISLRKMASGLRADFFLEIWFIKTRPLICLAVAPPAVSTSNSTIPEQEGQIAHLMSNYSWTTSSSDTTCAARTVDGGVRGAVIGAMWGCVRHYTTHRSSQSTAYKQRILRRVVLRSTVDFAAFLSIYSAVHCMAIRSSQSGTVAAGVAGAAAGCFVGAKSGTSGKIIAGTGFLCSAVSMAVHVFQVKQE